MNIALLKQKRKHCFYRLAQTPDMHLGKRIKDLMAVKKISTKEMATYCGVTPGAVSNWFSTGRITKANLAKVAKLLEADLEALSLGEDQPPKPPQGATPPQTEVGLSQAALKMGRLFDAMMGESPDPKFVRIAIDAACQAINALDVPPSSRPNGRRGRAETAKRLPV